MEKGTFNRLRQIVLEKSGISLSEKKHAMVSARIQKRLTDLGLKDATSYMSYVSKDQSGEEVINLLDVISTNVTNFFREPAHFTFMGEVFKSRLEAGQTKFRFWSAASSTGEEPYTMAMTLLDIAVK